MKPKSLLGRTKHLTFVIARADAMAFGLLTCLCRHPENNHFDHGRNPCAHCDCLEYQEVPRVGMLRS